MRINIIGAGITGLSAAYFLTQKGHEVRVFDRASEVGGLAGFFPVEGTYLEKYYHHTFAAHTEFIELIEELNIEKGLFFRKTRMGFFYKGSLYPFATAKDLLSFTPLKMKDRLRLGLASCMMMQIKDWRNLEKRSALEWLRTYSGDESCKIIWGPLLRMKFGDEYDRISAAWLWNRVVDRKSSKKGEEKGALGYIKGGYKRLLDALVDKIKANDGQIYTDTSVDEICVSDGKSTGVKTNGKLFEGDKTLVTVPIRSFIDMAPFLPGKYRDTLTSIKYQGSVCVILKLKNSLSDYYWINVSDPASPFVGIIEHTNLVSPEEYGGHHLVYLTRYASSEDTIFSRPDGDIYKDFITHLKMVFPEFMEDDVEEYRVFNDRFSQPVFVKEYSKVMPDTSTPVENLYLLNTSQIYPQSRCVNSSIVKAQELVTEMLSRYGR